MGWDGLYGQFSKEKFLSSIGVSWDGEKGDKYERKEFCWKSNRVWWATFKNGQPFLVEVALIKINKKANEWMYKHMDETVGPCFYDCPKKLLKMVPWREELGGYSKTWREKVLNKTE